MERNTRQRFAIRDAIVGAAHPLLPQEALETAPQEVPGLGLATLYRSLTALLEDGELGLMNLPGKSPRFEGADHHHHHHFQCTTSHRVLDVHACPGGLSKRAPRGFTVEDHDLTLYG
jgi:Fur family transcriptional regulator, ferric uptake regulator